MAKIKPFRGIRPPRELVEQVASRPYDVLNSEEARAEAEGNEKSVCLILFSYLSKRFCVICPQNRLPVNLRADLRRIRIQYPDSVIFALFLHIIKHHTTVLASANENNIFRHRNSPFASYKHFNCHHYL